jgi:hypothetical protein
MIFWNSILDGRKKSSRSWESLKKDIINDLIFAEELDGNESFHIRLNGNYALIHASEGIWEYEYKGLPEND